MPSSLGRWVLAITIALSVVLGAVLWLPEPGDGHGGVHPDHATMLHGGSGFADRPLVLALGWIFGLLVVGFVVTVMAFGAPCGPRRRELQVALAWGGAAWAATLTVLVAVYYVYAGDLSPPFLLGLPLPAAVMVYGVWFVPWILVILYVRGFGRWVLTPEDRRRFDELVARRRAAGD